MSSPTRSNGCTGTRAGAIAWWCPCTRITTAATAVAAAELAVMAGADRVEGCLFGNGERTGNVCLVTLAMNLYSQGIDPMLDFGDISSVIRTAEYCTALPVHPRHPYAGELVFTAFSGSHQDAIKKGFAAQRAEEAAGNALWDVPYLPIDPADVGRTYEAVIRVNSQSGKGGIAFLLERDYGLALPRLLQIEFSQVVQEITDTTGKELTPADIHAAFHREYVAPGAPVAYVEHRSQRNGASVTGEQLTARLTIDGVETLVTGSGNGPVDAFVHALREEAGIDVHVLAYHEHATGSGEDATAVAYVQLRTGGRSVYGVGLDPNIVTATLKAVVCAVNRGSRKAACWCDRRSGRSPPDAGRPDAIRGRAASSALRRLRDSALARSSDRERRGSSRGNMWTDAVNRGGHCARRPRGARFP